jgi:hypothetical protein
MGVENFLDKTDLLLYKKLLSTIITKWDEMDSSTLGELMDKMRELHNNIETTIHQKKVKDTMNTNYTNIPTKKEGIKESTMLKSILNSIKK